MIDLTTGFIGMTLKNPIVVSACGLTANIQKLREAEKNQAGVVILKTMVQNEFFRQQPSPNYLFIGDGYKEPHSFTFYSYEHAFEGDLKQYTDLLKETKKDLSIPIIASINANDKETWIKYSKSVEEAGADAIELNISSPIIPTKSSDKFILDISKSIKNSIKIPVIVKLSGETSELLSLIKNLKDTGINAVSLFNSFPGLEINIERESPLEYQTYSVHSGNWSIYYPLKWVSNIFREVKDLELAASGGVSQGKDVVKYLLAGASVVEISSSIYLKGFSVIKNILKEVIKYMSDKKYKKISDFRGKAAERVLQSSEVDLKSRVKALINRKGIPPCQDSCPAKINVQGFITLLLAGKYEEGLALIRKQTPFASICGRICHSPCEINCIRGKLDESIAIEKLTRFLSDKEDYELLNKYPYLDIIPEKNETTSDKKVAVIGAGPAGLTCAYHLNINGYNVDVFEAENKSGGMLRTAIPGFRLPKNSLEQDLSYINRCGIKIKTGVKFGKDFSFEELKEQGYKAIFLGIGAQKANQIGIEGENLNGIYSGIDFLKKINTKKRIRIGKQVVVIGGNKTAVYSARTALRLGVDKVTLIFEKTKDDMSVTHSEFMTAVEEGIDFQYLVKPVEFSGTKRVNKIKCFKPKLGESRETQNEKMNKEQSLFEIDADTVIIAQGQKPDIDGIDFHESIEINEEGYIKVDPDTLETGFKGIFAGGDLIEGEKSAINAIASGKKAAGAIIAYLEEKIYSEPIRYQTSEHIITPEEVITGKERIFAKNVSPFLYIKERVTNFNEIDQGFDDYTAIKEAERCLMCGICSACNDCLRVCPHNAIIEDGYHTIITEDCVGCGLCVQVCYPKAIELKDVTSSK